MRWKSIKAKEHDIQKAILDYLAYKKIISWRQNSGAIELPYTYKKGEKKGETVTRLIRFITMNYPKVTKMKISDIGGIYNNKFLAIECKSPGEKPDQFQLNYLNMVNDNGGLGFWADSLEYAMSRIK